MNTEIFLDRLKRTIAGMRASGVFTALKALVMTFVIFIMGYGVGFIGGLNEGAKELVHSEGKFSFEKDGFIAPPLDLHERNEQILADRLKGVEEKISEQLTELKNKMDGIVQPVASPNAPSKAE